MHALKGFRHLPGIKFVTLTVQSSRVYTMQGSCCVRGRKWLREGPCPIHYIEMILLSHFIGSRSAPRNDRPDPALWKGLCHFLSLFFWSSAPLYVLL